MNMSKCHYINLGTGFGDSYYSTGNRLYIGHGIKLLSWRDRKCIDCGKFLTKHYTGLRCKKCGQKHANKLEKEWRENHKEYLREYYRNYDIRRGKIKEKEEQYKRGEE